MFIFWFAMGFVVGAVVVGCSLWPLLVRWKTEYDAMAEALDATHDRMRNNEKNRALAQKQVIAAHKQLEQAHIEIERLRQEQLKAWGIPDQY